MIKKTIKFLTISLFLACNLISCTKNKDEKKLDDNNSIVVNNFNIDFYPKVSEGYINLSSINFSHIENLFALPLSAIIEIVEGRWKLVSTSGGIEGKTNIVTNGAYMELTSEHIRMGDNTSGNSVDSPVIWAKGKNSFKINDIEPYVLTYNHEKQDDIIIRASLLVPMQFINDTLMMWDLRNDGFFYFFVKY